MKGYLCLMVGVMTLASGGVPCYTSAAERGFEITNDQFMRDGKPSQILSGRYEALSGRV